MKSLDSCGHVDINNDKKYHFFDSMFVRQEINVRDRLFLDKENEIKIMFYSPVELTEKRAGKFRVLLGKFN